MSSTVTRRVRSAGVLACVALVLAACGGGGSGSNNGGNSSGSGASADSGLVAKAKSEGSVVFVSSAVQDQLTPLADAFQKKYGIKVTTQAVPTSPLKARVQSELQGGTVTEDVIDISEKAIFDQLSSQGSLADLSSLPNWKSLPGKYKTNDAATVSLQANTIIWNTDQVKQKIKSWSDLLANAKEGKVVAIDPATSPVITSFYAMLDKTQGSGFLEKLAALKPRLVPSGALAAQLVASGEESIGLPVVPSALPALTKAGAPIDSVVPDPTSGPIHWAGVLAKAPHPNAARLFMVFLMGPDGQAAYNAGQLGASVLPNVSGVLSVPPGFVPPDEALDANEAARVKSVLH